MSDEKTDGLVQRWEMLANQEYNSHWQGDGKGETPPIWMSIRRERGDVYRQCAKELAAARKSDPSEPESKRA